MATHKQADMSYGPGEGKNYYPYIECPTEGCENQHPVKADPRECSSCKAVINMQVIAGIVAEGEAHEVDTSETEPEVDTEPESPFHPWDGPFEITDGYVEQQVV